MSLAWLKRQVFNPAVNCPRLIWNGGIVLYRHSRRLIAAACNVKAPMTDLSSDGPWHNHVSTLSRTISLTWLWLYTDVGQWNSDVVEIPWTMLLTVSVALQSYRHSQKHVLSWTVGPFSLRYVQAAMEVITKDRSDVVKLAGSNNQTALRGFAPSADIVWLCANCADTPSNRRVTIQPGSHSQFANCWKPTQPVTYTLRSMGADRRFVFNIGATTNGAACWGRVLVYTAWGQPSGGPWVLPPENFWKFYMPKCAFCGIFVQ